MTDRISFDDFDWAGTSTNEPPGSSVPPPIPDEAPPPPAPPQDQGRRSEEPTAERDWYDQPAKREWYGRKNVYKRPKRAAGSVAKFDDFDWGGELRTGEPAYNPDDDWAITRGFKVGEQGGGRAIKASIELARISQLSPDQQRAEMLKLANAPRDPSEAQLQIEGVEDIDWSPSRLLTWLGESAGQMTGSMLAAAEYGGLPGAAIGGGLGAAVGATGAGIGAAPGAVAGGVAGFTSGSLAAYAGMGVGGLFEDLLSDEGVKAGLADGSIDTDAMIKLTTLAGLTIGAFDAIPATKAVGRLTGKAGKGLVKDAMKNAILQGAKRGAKEEGVTEAIQGAISEIAQAFEGGNMDVAERALSVLNQGLVGAVGGAGPGALGGGVQNANAPYYGPQQNIPPVPPVGPQLPSVQGPPAPPGARPATPAGMGGPNPANTPHNPVGGTGQTPAPPAGKTKQGATRIPVVPTGGVDPTIASTLTPAPPAPTQRVGTGDKDIDLTLGVGTQGKPVHAPADPNISVTEGLPNYGVPQPPAPAPAPPIVPPAPPVPAPPAPPQPAAPTPDATLAPAGPTTAASAFMQPPVGQPVEVEDMSAGLPRYEPVPDEEAELEIPAGPVAAPALVEEPKPIPVTVVEEPEVRLDVPETKGERVKQRPAKRLKSIEPELYEEQVGETGERLKVERDADVREAKDILNQFRGNPERYGQYYNALSKQLKDYLGEKWHPDYVPEAPAAAKEVRRKRAKPYGRPKQPPKRERDVRAPVKVGEYKRTAPVKKGKLVNKAVAVTREVYEAIKAKHGPKAYEQLSGATVRIGKKVGQIIDFTEKEPPPPKAMEQGKRPHQLKVAGKITTIRRISKEIDEHEHAIRALQNVIVSKERMIAALKRRKGAKRQDVVDEMNERIATVRKKLAPLLEVRESDLYKQHERYERAHPERIASAQAKIEEITPTEPVRAFKLSFQEEPVTEEELFRDYQVKHKTEEIQQPEQAEPVLTKPQIVLARLRAHFADPDAAPARLASLGLDEKQRRALEARGMAYKGSMDRGEFELYEASETGIAKPPPATIKPTEKERRVSFARYRSKKEPYTPAKRKRPSKEPAEERLGGFRWSVSPQLDLEVTPEKEAKIVGVTALQVGHMQAETQLKAEKPWLFDRPKEGEKADRQYVDKVKAVLTKFQAGVWTRTETFEKLLGLQQKRADAWLVTNRAIEMANQRMGAKTGIKAAPAVAKEEKQTWKRRALAEKKKHYTKRDPIRIAMLPYFDILSKYHNKEKSKNERERDEAVREQAKANRALVKLHQQLIARAEAEDAARAKAIAIEALAESRRMQEIEEEGQRNIDAYLREQVAEGVMDPELADAMADKENRDFLMKYQKRDKRQVVTTPALQAAVMRTELPSLPEAKQPRWTKPTTEDVVIGERGKKGFKRVTRALEKQPKPRKTKFTKAEREKSEAFAATLRPIRTMSLDELTRQSPSETEGIDEIARQPLLETAGIDEEVRGRIIGFKLPDWYLQQTRTVITDFVENMRRELFKVRGRMKAIGANMPNIVHPHHNTIEENYAIFVRQRLGLTGRPRGVRGGDADFGSFTKQLARELGRSLTDDELVQASQDFTAEQNRIAEEYEETEGAKKVAGKRGFGKVVIPKNATALADYYAAQKRIFGKRGRGLGEMSKRGPGRIRAGAEEAMEQRGLSVKQRAHRTSNIHDAMQATILMQDIVRLKGLLARARKDEHIQRLKKELAKSTNSLKGIIFEHANMSKFAAQEEVEKPLAEGEERVAGKGTPLGFSETAIRPMEGLGESETSADLEEWAQEMEDAAEGFAAMKAEERRNAELEAATALKKRFETAGYVVTIDKKKYIMSPITLPEGPVSRAAMEVRPVGVPVRSLSGRQALDEWANKGQLKGWQRWLRGALIRSLRQLVGDIDVHVVDGIYANNKAGLFIPGPTPQILINREALGRPKLLADTIVHEMAHAATNYALHNNLRGTRDIVQALMRQLKKQLGDDLSSQSVEIQNAFTNADEFLAAFADHAPFQDMLASLSPDRATRAQIRALGKGRTMPTFWDQMVAMVENAIGFFTPAGHGGSYLSQVMKVYPHAAMSLKEQARHHRVEGGEMPNANAILEHPLDPRTWGDAIRNVQQTGVLQSAKGLLPADYLAKLMAQKHFGGAMVNPTTDLTDMLAMHPHLVTDEMAVGDQMDEKMVAWVNEDRRVREKQIEEGVAILTESELEDVDVTRDIAANTWIWDDANHPLKGGKVRTAPTVNHRRDAFKRAAHATGRAKWLALPQQVRDILHARSLHMSKQLAEFEKEFTENWVAMRVNDAVNPLVLPHRMGAYRGRQMTEAEAVKEILDGKISKPLKTALGENYQTIKGMGRITRKNRIYWPVHREGSHFISGRLDIPLPTVTRGTVHIDQQKLADGTFEFVFSNEQDMDDYLTDIARSGEDRLAADPRRQTVPGVNKKGKPVNKPTGNWIVPMQDRFMMMHDDPAELSKEKDRLMQQGDMRFISDPLQVNQRATLSGAMPLKLEKMIGNIDSMSGRTPAEKAVMKSMARTMFVQTQQGNRITKRLLKRTGARGYDTSYESIRVALRTNNEMMSRHKVSLKRLPKIAAAQKYLRDYTDAIARRGQPGAFDKLTAADQAYLNRNYAKGALDADSGRHLRADVKIIEDRIEGMMEPKGAPMVPEKYWRAFTTAVVMNYLAGPSYTALQMLSLPMFTWPRMVGEFARTGSVSSAAIAATQALYEAGTEVGSMGVYQKGVIETLMEGGEVIKGFAPRPDWLKHARTVRRSHDYLADLYARMRANNVPYVEEKIAMLELMRKRGAIGQAGLNQQNLQEDLLGPGIPNKILRGIKAGGKVFQAFQEAAEINNRAVPAIAYFNRFVREGKSIEEAGQLAANHVSREQVNYSKENWPTIANASGISQAFMFKKFGAVQAINYWDSLMRAFPGVTDNKEDARAARVHIATATLVLATLGGFSGNPLWEPLRMLNYLLSILGLNFLPTDWNEAKTNGESWLADNITGSAISEGLMYGAPRALGIDLSGRIAMDNVLFYKQPADMTPDDWLKTVGEAYLGAPGATAIDAVVGIHAIVNKAVWDDPGTTTWGKDISKLPLPKMIKDIIKAAELVEYGPRTTTGVSTGDPIGLTTAIVNSLGFRSRESARPFEQGSAAQHRIEQNIDDKRNSLIQSITNGGYDRASMRRLARWNRSHPKKEERITMKNLSMARKRRRKVELDIRRKNLEAA